jgi:hypothetical protein
VGKSLANLVLVCGKGMKRQRRSACMHCTTRWKWPCSFRRCSVRTAWKRWQRWRYIVPARMGRREGPLREQMMVILPSVLSIFHWDIERTW